MDRADTLQRQDATQSELRVSQRELVDRREAEGHLREKCLPQPPPQECRRRDRERASQSLELIQFICSFASLLRIHRSKSFVKLCYVHRPPLERRCDSRPHRTFSKVIWRDCAIAFSNRLIRSNQVGRARARKPARRRVRTAAIRASSDLLPSGCCRASLVAKHNWISGYAELDISTASRIRHCAISGYMLFAVAIFSGTTLGLEICERLERGSTGEAPI